MVEVLRAAAEVQQFLERQGRPFAFIGGIANLSWGEVRTTRDVDVSLLTNFTDELQIVGALLERFAPRRKDALKFALQARVVLLVNKEDVGIDIGLAGFEYERIAIERSVVKDYGEGIRLRVITAEDLVVMKAFAGRGQDWADIEGVTKRQGAKLDWGYIEHNLMTLAQATEDDAFVARALSYRQA